MLRLPLWLLRKPKHHAVSVFASKRTIKKARDGWLTLHEHLDTLTKLGVRQLLDPQMTAEEGAPMNAVCVRTREE
jgi:hypothetical protein